MVETIYTNAGIAFHLIATDKTIVLVFLLRVHFVQVDIDTLYDVHVYNYYLFS